MSESKSHVAVEQGSDRSFGIVFTLVFLLLGIVPYIVSGKTHYWALAIAAVLAVITLISPKLFKPFNILWFKFGMLLGAIIAPLVIIIIFFFVVTPTGLLMRLFGKDPLRLKRHPEQTSYWIKREIDPENPESMKNQF